MSCPPTGWHSRGTIVQCTCSILTPDASFPAFLEAESADERHDKVDDDEDDGDDEQPHLHVSAPHCVLEVTRRILELLGRPGELVGLLNQQLHPFPSVQHLIDVLHHDVLHAVQLALDAAECVAFPAVESLDELSHGALKFRVEGERDGARRALSELSPESLSHLGEKLERYSASATFVLVC